jgi:hypothetical protein
MLRPRACRAEGKCVYLHHLQELVEHPVESDICGNSIELSYRRLRIRSSEQNSESNPELRVTSPKLMKLKQFFCPAKPFCTTIHLRAMTLFNQCACFVLFPVSMAMHHRVLLKAAALINHNIYRMELGDGRSFALKLCHCEVCRSLRGHDVNNLH